MLNKEWYCDAFNTGINYSLSGKWKYIKSKMHQKNNNYSDFFTFEYSIIWIFHNHI